MGDTTTTIELETLEGLPEAVAQHFTEQDGKFRWKVANGAVVDEFRNTNIELRKRAEALEAKVKRFEGLDPEKAREADVELRKLRDAMEAREAGVEDDHLEELVQKRTERIIAERDELKEKYQKQVASFEELSREFDRARLVGELHSAATSIDGFVPQAIDDAEYHLLKMFRMEDGKAMPVNGAIGANGEPLTIREWLVSTKPKKPHWWHANVSGGGALGNDAESGNGVLDRRAFDALSPAAKMAHVKKYGAGSIRD